MAKETFATDMDTGKTRHHCSLRVQLMISGPADPKRPGPEQYAFIFFVLFGCLS